MGFQAVAFPIVPGKEEEWRQFVGALNTSRRADFVASRRALGVRERTSLQQTPEGGLVIVTLEGDDPAGAFARFAQTHDEFTDWFIEQVHELHGIDFRQPPPGPLPELIVDSGSQEEENKAVVLRFFDEILGKKNMAAIDDIIADDYVNYFPGAPAPLTKADMDGALAMFFTAFPDMAVHVESIFAEGDRVAIIGEITGTHQGEFQGIPATGKRVAIRNLSQYRVRDGKLVEDYPGFNPMDIMQQIGAMPVAEHVSA